MKTKILSSCLLFLFPVFLPQCPHLHAHDQRFIRIQNGYFYDPTASSYWLPHGIAYQTWNRPLGVWQTYDQINYDLDEMVKAHVNSVRVDFVWKEIEAAGDNQFDWSNYDYLLQACAQRGIKVFALAGYQWPPDWFPKSTAENPDSGWYTMHPPGYDNEGVYQPTRWRSDIISFENPNARAQYTEFLSAVAARYKNNPTLVAWIVGNEYGYVGLWSGKQDGYDDQCQGAFRSWLSTFYNGSISALNQVWGTSYGSFNDVQMPTPYNRDNPAWWDLVEWRQDSIAGYTAAGAKAVRAADPNHLISYSAVGTQWGDEDWRYHAEHAGKIVQACKDMGAPLDFWSINNYPWNLPGSELETARWGIVNAKWRTGLPVMYSETGFTSSETLFSGINEQNQGPLIRNALWEALESGVIGIHVFTWQDREYITDREKGFGITYADRRIKPAYWVVRDNYGLMEQIGLIHLLAGSKDRDPDVAIYWSHATDQMYNRYESNMQQLFGSLLRVGLKPTFMERDELLNSTYFKDVYQADPSINLTTVHGGTRSVKMNAANGGGSVAIDAADAGQSKNLSGATAFSVWVYDTQGSNTIQLRLRDVNGNGGSRGDGNSLWSNNASVANQWTKITWNLSQYPKAAGLDKAKIRSVELFEQNQGVYYFDDAAYTAGTEQMFQDVEKNNGTPRDYSTYSALILPRNMRTYPGDLSYIHRKVTPAGVNIYADADLPGMQDYHVNPLPDFVQQMNDIFGIDATNTSGYDDPVENEQFGIQFMPITTTVSQALAPLTQNRQDTFRVWKYSNMTTPTTGVVYARHSNGHPALVINNLPTAKAAITTFSLGDVSSDSNADGQPDIGPWAQRYDWIKAIFRTGFGINPALDVSGSQYVLVDYRTAADGSILISANNYLNDASQTVTITTTLVQGRTIENLTSGGIIATSSNGTFNLTLQPNGHELVRAYTTDAIKKVEIIDAPAVVHPMGQNSFQVKVRYDTLGAQNETLVAAFQEDGDNGDGVANEIYSSANAVVSGEGDQTLWLYIPDANKADGDYKSTLDGGKYIIHAWLEDNGNKVAEAKQLTQLEWAINPITALPTSLTKGQTASLNLQWQDLYAYQWWENTPLSRETAFPRRIAVVRSSKTQALFPSHYDKVSQTCDWLESLGYAHSNPAETRFDDVVVTGAAAFSDNFNTGSMANWTQVDGCSRWQVASNELSLDRIGQGNNMVVAGDSSWTNYNVEAKFKYVVKDPYFQETYLIFRYQNNDNYYYVKTYNNYGLWRIKYGGRVNGQDFVQNLANINEISANVSHMLKVQATGSNFQVYLDGSSVGTFTDTRLISGKIGLGAKASQLGVWEPTKGYYFVDDTERGTDSELLNLNWGYLKSFFSTVILPSVYVMNNDECYNLRAYSQSAQFAVIATDGGVGMLKPDGSNGPGRVESIFGVAPAATSLGFLQNLRVTDTNNYITQTYSNGQLIASNPNASATAWTVLTTGTKLADILNAGFSAPAMISNSIAKGDVSFQDFEPDNSTPGAYFYDAWQASLAFETGIVQAGSHSVKMTVGSGGGTIGLNLGAPGGTVDLSSIVGFYAWVYDTQDNNTVQIKFKDKWGNLSSMVWSPGHAIQNQWTQIYWPITPAAVTGVDWKQITSIELYEQNAGTYYFDTTYARTSDYGDRRSKAYVFNFGVDTFDQMTNQYQLIAQRVLDSATREIYKIKIQLKYATPSGDDFVLAEQDIWTLDGTGSQNVQFTLPSTTMTGDGNIYWIAFAYPWDASDPWLSQTGFYTSSNDPGFQSSIAGYGLLHAGATPLAMAGRTFDNWVAYNTRGQSLTLNFGLMGDGDNGDGLVNKVYGGSPMFDGVVDPNAWLEESAQNWVSNAVGPAQRPRLFLAFKDIASATSPKITMAFQLAGSNNQVMVEKTSDETTWTNIYSSPTAASSYTPTINLDTAAKYYRITLNDGGSPNDKITLNKAATLSGYPSAKDMRFENWLQSEVVNGVVDDFRPPYTPNYALVPDYDPGDPSFKDGASGGKYRWATWFTESSDLSTAPTKVSWAPRLKVEDPAFPTVFDPGTTVYVPVVWNDLDTIVMLTQWKPYQVSFPMTLRIFLQDVYLGVTYMTSDFLISTGSGNQMFPITIPANTPYGANYMWGAYIFDHKRPGIQPYEERIGMDDTFRFTPEGLPYEPETTITVGTVFSVYSDAGVPSDSTVFTWGVGSWDGSFTGETPPEGTECFQTTTIGFAGWGVFKVSGTYDLSSYASGHLKFWVKSTSTLKVEIESPGGITRTKFISSTAGQWQEISIAISSFTGVDPAHVSCPLKITAQTPTTFYVDSVRWTRD